MIGYPSPLWFGDSTTYLQGALSFEPSRLRPSGYSVFLWLLKPFESFTVTLSVQHAIGVLTGVLVYLLVWRGLRAGWPRWWSWVPGVIATALTVPVLYDAYQIELEHMLMSDGLFTFLLLAAVTVVLWRRRMSWWMGALAGVLMAFATLVRSTGLPLLLVVLLCMLIRRVGWRAIAAAMVGAAIPILIYMSWFDSVHGRFALTNTDKVWLYGRTVDFADCSIIKPRPEVAPFCRDGLPRNPEVAPALGALWGGNSGFSTLPDGLYDPQANKLAGEFAMAAITKQPGDYLKVIWRDTVRCFEWERANYPSRGIVDLYEFPVGASLSNWQALHAYPYGGSTADARVVEPQAAWVRDYQDRYFVRGPYLGAFMAVGLLGVLLRIRRLGGEVLLPLGTGLALLVIPAATADFDYRYILPALPFAVMAAGLTLARTPKPTIAPPEPVSLVKATTPKPKPNPNQEQPLKILSRRPSPSRR
ncbi:hypothetical protein [Actinomadura rudentiformis]|uniref:Glycosyltransferase RgtA/B/C/D-like domain-containing protein n=1 Tax=Actinomadura rudentiformis TaxID=359158 RepID=A0A6H9ZB50_9ACTN|nr:hypothetical protein [Actinomadura rudentiformis]KAB2351552.1 hypothetical protein F8566_04800 [Actinomadura rudentiformis]